MKSIFLLFARPGITKSFEVLHKIYQQNQHVFENQLLFQRFVDILEFLVTFMFIEYAVTYLVALMTPGISYLFTGTVEYVSVAFVPGLSLDSWHCIFHCIFQEILHSNSIFVYCYFDLLFVVQVLHVILMTNILCKKIRAISRRIKVKRRNRRLEIALNLRNLIKLHNELLG